MNMQHKYKFSNLGVISLASVSHESKCKEEMTEVQRKNI